MSRKIKSCLLLCLFVIMLFSTTVFAGAFIKLYTISTGNTRVYSNSSLTTGIGWIYDTDEITLLEVNEGRTYCKVTYPISGGRTKTGYVPFSSLFTSGSGNSYTARAQITTYRRPSGARYGFISKNDTVIVMGTKGAYTQVRYPVSGGYKFAFITTSDYNSYIKPQSSSSSSRATYISVFASPKGKGYSMSQAKASASTSYKKGDFIYAWGSLHDANGNLYKSYGSGTCDLTISFYRPNGSCAYFYKYSNSDNNWVGCELDTAGTWKVESKVSGSLNGSCSQSITVKDNQTVSAASTLKLSSYTTPGTITQGSGFTCRGTVSSNYKISKVTVGVWDASGNEVTSTTVYPSAYSYNIYNLDSKVHFSYAKPGTNYYKIYATDEKQTKCLLNWSFTVRENTTRVLVSQSQINSAARQYGISTSSNAYKALLSINTKYYSQLSANKSGTLVFLFEGVGNYSSSSKRMNAMCVVVKNGQIKYINRNSSTIPDYPFSPSKNGGTAMPTIKSGVYSFTTVNHRGSYAALNVSSAKVVRFKSKTSYYSSTSSAINVHRRSSDSISAWSNSWVNSAGCQLIGATGTSSGSEYARFIQAVGIVSSGSKGNAKYNTRVSGKIVIDRAYAYNYLSNVGYSSSAIKAIG